MGRNTVPWLVLLACFWGPRPLLEAATASEIPVAAATRRATTEEPAGELRITYPLDGAVFPPEIVAPTIVWEAGPVETGPWEVDVRPHRGARITAATTTETHWRPGPKIWAVIKEAGLAQDLTISVRSLSGSPIGTPGASTEVQIRTSPDPVGDSLFYREVPLPFLKAVQDPSKIRWRYGTIDMEDGPPIVLENLPVCGNCHSFADNGSVLGLDVDYGNDKGGYGLLPISTHMVMEDENIITWSDYKRDDGELTFGLLSRVSPTGRYVISTVKDRSVFVARDELMISQLFFPIKGILVVYDRQTKKFAALPGADDPRFVQTNPVWSPDGKEILFARTLAHTTDDLKRNGAALVEFNDVQEFTQDNEPFRYDIYRIPFHEGRGGVATPLLGAADNGRSNYFPKYSPDGKWIVFTQSEDYMLLRPDSELFIVPAAGGIARRLRHNTERMNSWHSWSSNSRWLVFSSKQNGPYTQMWLTHIDADGNDTPPVVLDRFTDADRAANIPEFVNLPGDAIAEIREEFLDPYSFLRAGTANQRTGDQVGAERAFRRGLALSPDDAELRNALGWTLFQTDRSADAVIEYQRALAANPTHARTRSNLALAYVDLGNPVAALLNFQKSIELEPRCEIYADLGLIHDQLGREDQARLSYERGIALDAGCPEARLNLAAMLVEDGEYREAAEHFRAAIRVAPSALAHTGLGFVLSQVGELPEAVAEHRQALKLRPDLAQAHSNLGLALARQGELSQAALAYRRAAAIDPRVPTYYSLAGILRTIGRDEEADIEYEKARTLSRELRQAQ
jgi:Flp pilus assembly protein TadD